MASFNILDKNSTKPEWEEVVREVPRMWEQVDYSYQGDHFTVPTPHNVLPKPYGQGHPPIWVACGNPPTFARAGELGIGAIAFNFEPIFNLRGRIEAYKNAIADCKEPLGQFMNDNVMMTNAVICFEDRDKARKIALERVAGYLVTMVNLYHDTMPKSPDAITWPGAPMVLRDLAGSDPDGFLDQMIAGGYMLVGNPEEVSKQLESYKSVGCDQLVFGMPQDLHRDEILELLETFGDQVIPEHDPDPVHSTDRYRATAVPKYGPFSSPLPDIQWPTVLPVTATSGQT
jgi:alkanesulfonate monooxygenase SsuD/methylene tetrahydromethanopterin reductase-like flavin-dependent oxidoreductase (luciferase family)